MDKKNLPNNPLQFSENILSLVKYFNIMIVQTNCQSLEMVPEKYK